MEEACDCDLVDHLSQLTRACFAHACTGTGIGVDDRSGLVIGVLVAPAHDAEHTVFGAGLSAGDGRINEADAVVFGRRVQRARDIGGDCCVIDEYGACSHRPQCAIFP